VYGSYFSDDERTIQGVTGDDSKTILDIEILKFGYAFWLRPNQSLKLTEPAIDDFAARKKIFKETAMSARVYSTGNWLHVAAA